MGVVNADTGRNGPTLTEWLLGVRESIDEGRRVRIDELRDATPEQLDRWGRELLEQDQVCEAILIAVRRTRSDVLAEIEK